MFVPFLSLSLHTVFKKETAHINFKDINSVQTQRKKRHKNKDINSVQTQRKKRHKHKDINSVQT
jgi:hypothetical protein